MITMIRYVIPQKPKIANFCVTKIHSKLTLRSKFMNLIRKLDTAHE